MLLFLCVESLDVQLIIEYRLVCRRKLELDSSLPSCCSVVVVHCTSLPIKKYYGRSQLGPLVLFAGTHSGIEVWGVGLRWDDDGLERRIMCLWCECRC